MNIYTIEDIAKILGKNKLVIRHWIVWDEQTPGDKLLPDPFKVIGTKRKTRLYDEKGLEQFKWFNQFLKKNPGLMADYNKKHFWKK